MFQITPEVIVKAFIWYVPFLFFNTSHQTAQARAAKLQGVFNLVPAPPLDGSAAIMIFMSDSTARRYLDWLRGGSFGLFGLVIAIMVFRYAYAPIQELAVRTLLLPQFF